MSVGRLDWEIPESKSQFKWSGSKITSVTLHLHIQLYMPTWTKRKTAPKSHQNEWSRFWNALLEHERGHYEKAVQGVKVMYRELLKSTPDKIEARYKQLEAAMNSVQSQYDVRTDHGKRQQTKYGSTIIVVGDVRGNESPTGKKRKEFESRVRQRKVRQKTRQRSRR